MSTEFLVKTGNLEKVSHITQLSNNLNFMEDLYWEHEAQHTSEDWAELQNKCSSCYSAIKRIRNYEKGNMELVGKSIRNYVLEDMITNPNPLDND